MAGLGRRGRDPDRVEEDGGQDGEDEVEEEAAVGFQAQDAGRGAEDGRSEGLQIRERLHSRAKICQHLLTI